jgi:hypothetical protein
VPGSSLRSAEPEVAVIRIDWFDGSTLELERAADESVCLQGGRETVRTRRVVPSGEHGDVLMEMVLGDREECDVSAKCAHEVAEDRPQISTGTPVAAET